MNLLQHEMLVACFFSCFCIPFDLRWLFLNLISIQIVKGNCPVCQTCHLQVSDVINIAGIFQNRRNIRSHIAVSVLHADDHRTVLTGNINLPGIILEHDRQGIGTADTDHGMVDGIYRSVLVFLVIVIDELHCHFGVCGRIELIVLAKKKGLKTLGIVNVVGSSIAREADNVFYTLAGPEIAVATTKAYSTQLIAGYCLAVQFALVRGCISQGRYQDLISQLQCLPEQIQKILDDKERIQWFAAKQANARDAFFIGRGLDYAISLEGSLKMKEISYIHSEAYAAGELKHGTISLIEDGTLVIGVLTQSELYEKTISNMVECKSRGAYLMGLTTYGNYNIEDTASFTVYVPKTEECFATSLAVIPLQLMGYYVSVAKGLDVDKPRNLAKSVTVE